MANSGRGAGWFVAAGLLVAAVFGGYVAYRSARGPAGSYTYRPTTTPATTQTATDDDPGTRPATKPAKPPRGPTTTFIDVVRTAFPRYATSQPLLKPVGDFFDGARITLTDPVYLAP